MLNMRRLAYGHDDNETLDIEMTNLRFKSRFSMRVGRHRPSELNVTDIHTGAAVNDPQTFNWDGIER